MNRSRQQRFTRMGILALVMLLLVQSVVATLPSLGPRADPAMSTASTEQATMPCEHGDCCDENAPPSTPCDEMTTCASSDCALRAIASLPAIVLAAVVALPPGDPLPADATRWLLTRHDTPLLRPPISA